jgi:hypothetical protein
MNLESKIALISLVLSLASLLTSVMFAFISHRQEKFNERLQRTQLQMQYFSELRDWADEVCELIAKAIHHAELDPVRMQDGAFFRRRNRLRSKLASLIDRGRWFFPSVTNTQVAAGEPARYLGYHGELLNGLVSAYQAITALNYQTGQANDYRRLELVGHQREFVSRIQDLLDPADQAQEFRAVSRPKSVES